MITRRIFAFLAGAAPVLGKDIATAAVESIKSNPVDIAKPIFAGYTTSEDKITLRTDYKFEKQLDHMRSLLRRAKKLAEGPASEINNMHSFPDFDPDLLTSRSFSLAGAEYIQRRRDRESRYNDKLRKLRIEFEKEFGMPFSFDKIAEFTKMVDDIAQHNIPMPCKPKKMLPPEDFNEGCGQQDSNNVVVEY